ncbi:hypothetical protein TNCT_255621 [Trichonephila clavata]|uniref:Uncharacterized protein n=1 Tax=Trichonephila clavata TaxID=2740835 RepID=A0A8X6FY25_TRICU|nr:hypothetical protein TNCT_255621 [Trichonephila clavata]
MKSINDFNFCLKTRAVMSCLSTGDCPSSKSCWISSQAGLHPLTRGILFGQWKGPLRGRVCGGRVACVAGDGFEVRYAENVLEVEGLGSGWLGDGDSFISRNPPWLRPWTVPGSTLWGFPRCLALKNPPAVPLGTLEKCGNSWPGGGYDGTGSNPCFCQEWRQI